MILKEIKTKITFERLELAKKHLQWLIKIPEEEFYGGLNGLFNLFK